MNRHQREVPGPRQRSLGTLILDEPVSPVFLLGGLFVLAGVYVGAIAPSARPFPAQGAVAQEPGTAVPVPAPVIVPTPPCP